MLKKYWQNLGMTYDDIKVLPHYTFEMLNEIMLIEEKNQQKEIENQQKRG